MNILFFSQAAWDDKNSFGRIIFELPVIDQYDKERYHYVLYISNCKCWKFKC